MRNSFYCEDSGRYRVGRDLAIKCHENARVFKGIAKGCALPARIDGVLREKMGCASCVVSQ
jgi:hypothetical protein